MGGSSASVGKPSAPLSAFSSDWTGMWATSAAWAMVAMRAKVRRIRGLVSRLNSGAWATKTSSNRGWSRSTPATF